ncbi:carboxypeptidase-like regulatory domain-containing protein [Aquimarina mytili]|uniref:Carboxypeptidase-like regulatory domain-containing protein n=1 Tax=Aquimarina mytili TaxID=874423 RepID=A0A936ZWI1_9FLAO|nr:carboxypeptidase-like regulatory domain-containing protein [Aquimarina mytili]MBL0685582.1 carboxypeptidase-like regulatory domain-containing protein [Aquimarina mytili]
MRNRGLLFLSIFLATTLFSYGQYEVLIDAFVLNQDTNQPISYANVGFVDKGIGTITNKNGRFYLRYDEDRIEENDIIQFSGIGYQSMRFTYKQLFQILHSSNKIFLAPVNDSADASSESLEEIKQDALGYITYDSDVHAYWRDKNALGSQIGAFIRSPRKNTKLTSLKFNVVENTADSVLVRVNIYKNNEGVPGDNIVNDNIYHTISRKKGEETVDLSAYNIVANEDFIASIELLKVYGENLNFTISGSKVGHSFVKNASQDSWHFKKDAGVAFKIDTQNPLSSYTTNERVKPKHITMYWDTSLSMKEKNIDQEIQFLEHYFSEIISARVDLITFSNQSAETKPFVIQNGEGKDLINEIKAIKYNGATNFSTLFKGQNNTDQYLVFTDGNYNYGKPEFAYHVPVFYMSSKLDSNHSELQQSASFTNGLYVNLLKTDPALALDYIFNKKEDALMYDFAIPSEVVQGVVLSEDNTPVQGCRVLVKGTLLHSETNKDGVFYVNAKEGDMLALTHFGFEDKEILVDVPEDIKISLKPKYNELGQVRVSTSENDGSKEVVNFGGMKKEKQRLGYAAYTVTKDRFLPSAIFLTDIIRSRFPSINTRGNGNVICNTRSTSFRRSCATPLFVVDGVPIRDIPMYLLPSMIESITYVPGFSGTIQYGPSARNGVFYINTVLFVNNKAMQNIGHDNFTETAKNYSHPKLTYNFDNKRPKYLDALFNSNTYREALDQYFDLIQYHGKKAAFFIHSFEYFKKWNDNFSREVLSNLIEISNSKDYEALRALAFRLEELGDQKSALLVYENIFEIRPSYAQSYLDLARTYKENKRYQDAFEIYKIMLQNKDNNVDFTPLLSQVKSQIQHLLNNHRVQVSYTDVPTQLLVVKSAPVRIVFDWNDPEAEFVLQFVNPKMNYYEWSNQSQEYKASFKEDVSHKTLSKEFIIEKSFEGQWVVNLNVNRKTAKSSPSFLKYTIYTNYGLPNETKEIKFIKLYDQKEKVTLDKFSI